MRGDADGTIAAAARQVSRAAGELLLHSGGDRAAALAAMAEAVADSQEEILEANTLDLEASRDMAVPELFLDWLRLTPERLQAVARILSHLATLPDPIGRVTAERMAGKPSQSCGYWWPLGTIAFAYEAFPELAAIAAGMALKTGNGLLLKGSSESNHTNSTITEVLQEAIAETQLPGEILALLPAGERLSILDLGGDGAIDLLIPYGRANWMQQSLQQAGVPVLKAAMGNCYLYWSAAGNLDLALSIVLDSHTNLPDPVNAIEKILVDGDRKSSSIATLWSELQERGFEIRGDEALASEFPDLKVARTEEWGRAYLNKTIAFKQVENIEFALAWANRYSSGHADCIVTESYEESRKFALGSNSTSVYINTSPRFDRLSDDGSAVFLGTSDRGLIGLESLMRVKQVIQG